MSLFFHAIKTCLSLNNMKAPLVGTANQKVMALSHCELLDNLC